MAILFDVIVCTNSGELTRIIILYVAQIMYFSKEPTLTLTPWFVAGSSYYSSVKMAVYYTNYTFLVCMCITILLSLYNGCMPQCGQISTNCLLNSVGNFSFACILAQVPLVDLHQSISFSVCLSRIIFNQVVQAPTVGCLISCLVASDY